MFSIPSSIFCRENQIASSPAAQLYSVLLCAQFLAFQINISCLNAEGGAVKEPVNGIYLYIYPPLSSSALSGTCLDLSDVVMGFLEVPEVDNTKIEKLWEG